MYGIVIYESFAVVVLVNGFEGLADVGQVLPYKLIGQTAFAELEFWMFGVLGTHAADGGRRDSIFRNAANFLYVIFTVEEISVDPSAAFFEQSAILLHRGPVTEHASNLFGSAQCSEIIHAAKRIRTVELDVISVVLHAVHDAVAMGVPATWNPSKRERVLNLRPVTA